MPASFWLRHPQAIAFQSAKKAEVVGYCGSDVYLHTAPLFHVGGLSSCHANLAAGAQQVFLGMPKFDLAAFLDTAATCRVTSFIAVPTMLSDLSRGAAAALPAVRRVLVGAGGMSPALIEATQRQGREGAAHPPLSSRAPATAPATGCFLMPSCSPPTV